MITGCLLLAIDSGGFYLFKTEVDGNTGKMQESHKNDD